MTACRRPTRTRARFLCAHCRAELPPPEPRADLLVTWCVSCRAEVTADPAVLVSAELEQRR